MLHRKIYKFHTEEREVSIFLRDQHRWIEGATIVEIEGDLVTVRYELEEEEEVSSWEEIVRLDSIGSITHKLASVIRGAGIEPLISEDCPEAEQFPPQNPERTQD